MRDDLRELDELEVPDLRSRSGRSTRYTNVPVDEDAHTGRLRLVAGVAAVVVFLAAGGIALYALVPLGKPDLPAPMAPRTGKLSESMMLKETPGIRCTAAVPSVVQPGEQLGIALSLQNVTDTTLKASLFGPSFPLRVVAGDGSTWDTADLLNDMSGGFTLPTPLAPGESKTVQLEPLAVQFPGPLTIAPTCAGERMPDLHVDVANPGVTPTSDVAVARAIEATSGLFDGCAPNAAGSTVGTVSPPADASFSLGVRCAAVVRTAPGFAIVTLVMSTPSTAASPPVPNGLLLQPDLATMDGNAETVAWRFVVTPADVLAVASATHVKTVPVDAMDISYEVSSKGWSPGGLSRCGEEGFYGGGDGTGVTVEFVDECR